MTVANLREPAPAEAPCQHGKSAASCADGAVGGEGDPVPQKPRGGGYHVETSEVIDDEKQKHCECNKGPMPPAASDQAVPRAQRPARNDICSRIDRRRRMRVRPWQNARCRVGGSSHAISMSAMPAAHNCRTRRLLDCTSRVGTSGNTLQATSPVIGLMSVLPGKTAVASARSSTLK